MSEHITPLPKVRVSPWDRLVAWFKTRFSDVKDLEKKGYAVWFGMGVVIAIPEISASLPGKNVPWPTISGTVGHLEYRWPVVALVPVALIVFAAYHALRFPWPDKGQPVKQEHVVAIQTNDHKLRRTLNGRFTRSPKTTTNVTGYFRSALVIVIVGSVLARTLSDNEWLLGYVLYGLIATFWVIVPSILAYWFAKDVPFPTLFQTVIFLRRRLHLLTVVIGALLVILMIHLALYPWPSITRDLQDVHKERTHQQQPKQEDVLPPPSPNSR